MVSHRTAYKIKQNNWINKFKKSMFVYQVKVRLQCLCPFSEPDWRPHTSINGFPVGFAVTVMILAKLDLACGLAWVRRDGFQEDGSLCKPHLSPLSFNMSGCLWMSLCLSLPFSTLFFLSICLSLSPFISLPSFVLVFVYLHKVFSVTSTRSY